MAYVVDRVVICDAFREPDKHYEILSGGKSRLAEGRRPSKRYLVGGRDMKGSLHEIAGNQPLLFDEQAAANEVRNDFVNELRNRVREWRRAGYPMTALVTRRLLEWWFERDDERRALGKRLFFCQQEAVETVVYLFEADGRRKMPETGDLLRYALKLATGSGKTVVMAMLVVWSTLHKRKVAGSQLSTNFLVLVPNLTVQSRVSGRPRGDGLDPSGENNLYSERDLVPPEYAEEFRPNVKVENWQGIPLAGKREDWLPDEVAEEGRFIPASVLRAMRRRAQQDPSAGLRRMLKGWRDCLVFNDEAHHVYGEKRARAGVEPDSIKWSRILQRVSEVARVGLVVDLSATPWYGSGSAKPDGTLFEWLVCDFSVYDAFESGLVKVVRLPDPDERGHIYINLWDDVRGAKTEREYILGCKGAIDNIYSSWKRDFREWAEVFEEMRGPSPVMLCIADNATRAKWLFRHLTTEYELFKNKDSDDPRDWVTIQIDSKVFDADRGSEAVIREIVDTVGQKAKPGERVRCIVSVSMLSEGWDVKSVSHILGLRAFGSPLLTEQVIGRGLRRTDYDVLNQPISERPRGSDETVDAFGIPFLGFPVERRKRPKTGLWDVEKPVPIEPDRKKERFAVCVPNVRAWAVGVTRSLSEALNVEQLPAFPIDSRITPPNIHVKPVVGGQPEEVLTLEEFRNEWPLLKGEFKLTQELFEATNPDTDQSLGVGPSFEDLLDVVRRYVALKVVAVGEALRQDLGMVFWRHQALNILENAVRNASNIGTRPVPIPSDPEILDSRQLRKFHWTGLLAAGERCHTTRVPCHTDLEKRFADFLDRAEGVVRYLKNERFGFSVTYYENQRPRQYFPDFIVAVVESDGREVFWLAETKGEIRPNTAYKESAAETWCQRMTLAGEGRWRYLFLPQKSFDDALGAGVSSFAGLVTAMTRGVLRRQLDFVALEDDRVGRERFKTLLPLYSLRAAAGAFGDGEAVEPKGWVHASEVGKLDQRMFVVQAVGHSMEPTIHDGDYVVFRHAPKGSRQGKIVLAEYRGAADPDTGGAYTVKRFESQKAYGQDDDWRHAAITLRPDNPAYWPIEIAAAGAEHFHIVAEFVAVLKRADGN